MAQTDPPDVYDGSFYKIVITNCPSTCKLYLPFTISGYSNDETLIQHTFKLYVNDELKETIVVNDYEFSFDYTPKNPNLVGTSLRITVTFEAELDVQNLVEDRKSIMVNSTSISESVYSVYSLMKSTMEDNGIITSQTGGFISLLNDLGEL